MEERVAGSGGRFNAEARRTRRKRGEIVDLLGSRRGGPTFRGGGFRRRSINVRRRLCRDGRSGTLRGGTGCTGLTGKCARATGQRRATGDDWRRRGRCALFPALRNGRQLRVLLHNSTCQCQGLWRRGDPGARFRNGRASRRRRGRRSRPPCRAIRREWRQRRDGARRPARWGCNRRSSRRQRRLACSSSNASPSPSMPERPPATTQSAEWICFRVAMLAKSEGTSARRVPKPWTSHGSASSSATR